MARLADHGDGIALVFNRSDTRWWHRIVPMASAICFVRRRLQFVRSDGQRGGSAGAPSILLAFGLTSALVVSQSGLGYTVPILERSGGGPIDFPRIPFPASRDLFDELSRCGATLVSLHLLEASGPEEALPSFVGPNDPAVGRVGWSEETVWLDAGPSKKGQAPIPGSIGFRGVPEAVWIFRIGGYQVCHKWLKDRKGRRLSAADIAHYEKIIVALAETIRLMKEIDETINTHGGWPAAFAETRG